MSSVTPDRGAAHQPSEPRPIFTPSAAAVDGSQLTAFIEFCESQTDWRIGDSDDLHGKSIEHSPRFWELFLAFSNLRWEGSTSPVCAGDDVETARFFPDVRLSYPENLLACDEPEDLLRPAVTVRGIDGVVERLNRGELRRRTIELTQAVRGLGVESGDRVVGVLRNDAGSVVAALSAAAGSLALSWVRESWQGTAIAGAALVLTGAWAAGRRRFTRPGLETSALPVLGALAAVGAVLTLR